MKIPASPPPYLEIMRSLSPERLQKVMSSGFNPTPGGQYRHWDIMLHLQPPGDLTHKEWWLAVKFARIQLLKPLPLLDRGGNPFYVAMPDPVFEHLHRVDRDASGQIEISEQVTDPATRDRYLVSSLIEEAITSSQLEGAATTRTVAKEMLRSGRKPKDRSERMILNNYRAMRFLRDLKSKKLTPEMVLNLHRIVTESTLDSPGAAGRLRTSQDGPVYVWDQRDGTMVHNPPDASQLPNRLTAMCEFANGRTPSFFVHPVLRAIVLHFWVGYDHPFVDGNGRTARALFYWSMLSQGYWLCEFLTISSILRNAPAKYMRAYLFSETEGNDLTYFALYHLKVIERAVLQLHLYLKRKMAGLRETTNLLRRAPDLNHRQIAILGHALRHPGMPYTIHSHRMSHNVVYQTARTDLLGLEGKGLLERQRRGRKFYFMAPDDLSEKLSAGVKARDRRSATPLGAASGGKSRREP